MNDILDFHYGQLRAGMEYGEPSDEAITAFAQGVREDIVQYSPLLKDSSFASESEWRLISPANPSGPLVRLAGQNGIKVFTQFQLGPQDGLLFSSTGAEVEYIIGPSTDPDTMLQTVGGIFAETFAFYNGAKTLSTYR